MAVGVWSVLVRFGTVWMCGMAWRFWLGAARSGIAWLGPASFGTAVQHVRDCGRAGRGKASGTASYKLARYGRSWQAAVMEGRGLIGVRKSNISQGRGVFGSDMVRRLWLGTAFLVSSRCGSVSARRSRLIVFVRAHRGTASRGLAGQRKAVHRSGSGFCLGWAW